MRRVMSGRTRHDKILLNGSDSRSVEGRLGLELSDIATDGWAFGSVGGGSMGTTLSVLAFCFAHAAGGFFPVACFVTHLNAGEPPGLFSDSVLSVDDFFDVCMGLLFGN